ncbi:hypothetical protein AB4099_34710 [Bosea sp. 2KB_26]
MKEADLLDNMDEVRLSKVRDRDRLMRKYAAGLRALNEMPLIP